MSKLQVLTVIEAENFTPIHGMVFLYVEEGKKDRIKSGDFEFLLRVDYDPYATLNCVQDGIVEYLPSDLPDSYKELKVGDKVFTTHHLIGEKNACEVNGKKMRSLHYEDIYCIDRDGEIIPLGKWNLLSPVNEDESNWKTKGGLLLKPNLERVPRKGVALHTNQNVKEMGVNKGDLLSLRKNSEYEIDINGEILYVVHENDILAVIG